MRRSTERVEKLLSFRCDLDQIETLINQIRGQFGDVKIYSSIDIDLKREKYDFEDVSEIKSNLEKLPTQVTTFSIHFRGGGRTCYIRAGGIFSPAQISVNSDSEAWNAGITEICKDFSLRHRRWYYLINKVPLFWTGFFMLYLPIIILPIFIKKISIYVAYGWVLALISIGMLALARKYVFPVATIIFNLFGDSMCQKYLYLSQYYLYY